MFFVMLTITSRQMCFGSLHKTIWRKSKKFAVRSWSWLRSGSGIKIQSVEFAGVSEVMRGKGAHPIGLQDPSDWGDEGGNLVASIWFAFTDLAP